MPYISILISLREGFPLTLIVGPSRGMQGFPFDLHSQHRTRPATRERFKGSKTKQIEGVGWGQEGLYIEQRV